MSGEHDGPSPDEVEIERGGLTEAAVRPVGSSAHASRTRLLRRAGVFAALAVVMAGLIYSLRFTAPPAPPGQATPTAAAAFLPPIGLGCVQGAAWDPTSAFIALVGTPDTYCGNGSYAPNVVNIYRARTTALVRQLHPDAAVFAALGQPQPSPATPNPQGPSQYPQLTYQTLRWSPDGARLAITFQLFRGINPSNQYQIIATYGLVLLDADGNHEQVLVNSQAGNPTGLQPVYEVWDTRAGTVIPIGSAPSPTGPPYIGANSLPPALSYTWGSGGALVPGAPLTAVAPQLPLSLDLVGNPDGGARFGLWQPGQIQIIAEPVAGQQTPIYLDLFQTSFAAWSPDGRYFIDNLMMSALLLPNGQPPPSQSVLKAAQLDGVVELPVRDVALQQALANDFPLPVSLGNNAPADTFTLAWRPDGKVLAIATEGNGFILRAAATGQVLKSVRYIELPPSELPPPGAFGTSTILAWSPDGTWLLLPSLGLVHVGSLNVRP